MAVYDKRNADDLKKKRENYQTWLNKNSGKTGQQATSAILPITADSNWRRANNSNHGPDNSLRNPLNSFLPTKNPVAATTEQKKPRGGGGASYTVNAGNQPYVDQLNRLYDQIMNRKPFQYDLNGDFLYRQMADRYTQLGEQAMMDTMGQAAALTGGYGNSYAQSVGNQTYQQHLTALNDQLPSLYKQAFNVWQNEGKRLLQMYDLAAQHPGIIEALKPRTYTYTPKDEEEEEETSSTAAYQQLLTKMLSGSQEQAATNALANWYYQLMNAK